MLWVSLRLNKLFNAYAKLSTCVLYTRQYLLARYKLDELSLFCNQMLETVFSKGDRILTDWWNIVRGWLCVNSVRCRAMSWFDHNSLSVLFVRIFMLLGPSIPLRTTHVFRPPRCSMGAIVSTTLISRLHHASKPKKREVYFQNIIEQGTPRTYNLTVIFNAIIVHWVKKCSI